MRIKIVNVEIIGEIVTEMIGYSNDHLDIFRIVKSQRPDIDITQLRLFTRPVTMQIDYTIGRSKDVFHDIYTYKNGYIFDTASVPNPLKWLIDNDGANMYIPSIYHDGETALHFHKFKFVQAMFRALVYYYSKKYKIRFGGVKAVVAWIGTVSIFGKRIYNRTPPAEHFNYGKIIFKQGGIW